jgi:hypothetical protein|tara:strand:- start:264 stop:1499 length:1236 start_codon:yes stop_codon:yes gene_type:complete
MTTKHLCRHCKKELNLTFLDLGFAPPSNAYLDEASLQKSEKYYPLKVKVCDQCFLVQTEDYAAADEFFSSDYAYFSSTSSSFLDHAEKYSKKMINELNLDKDSFVIEVASNDGYLLKNFVSASIPCLGIEPTDSTAKAAEDIGVPTLRKFFGESLANDLVKDEKMADLIAGNNVYAHVPDINDFTMGLKTALKSNGTITLEFPHLLSLLEYSQFDTVYHEHFSYLSLHAVSEIFKSCELRVFDVEKLSTHGGSIRIIGCHDNDKRETTSNVSQLLNDEKEKGITNIDTYTNFQSKAEKIKDDLINFLIDKKNNGKSVVAYGAAAKGNTLMNFAGLKTDLIQFVCDAAEAKQGKYMPGSHIPILSPEILNTYKADYVLILPWNISDEVKQQNCHMEKNGTKFVIAVPEIKEI